MQGKEFQEMLAGLDRVTEEQWEQVREAVENGSDEAAVLALLELRVG